MKGSSMKYVKALLNIGIAICGLFLTIWLLPKLLMFFMPFVVGFIIACIAAPLVKFFEEKVKIKRKTGSAFVIIVVIGLVILVLYLAGAKLIQELIGFVEALPMMWEGLEQDFESIARNLSGVISMIPENIRETVLELGQSASDSVVSGFGKFSMPTIEALGSFAKQIPTILISMILGLLASYFFVAERGVWFEPVRSRMPNNILKRCQLIKESVKKAVGGYIKAQLKIEIWMYLLLVVGFLILRVDYVLLVALGIAFLDILPFFGTGTVMVPWAILKFLSGDYVMTIGLLIIWGVGQLLRQIIQPKIMGDSMGMPPVPTLFLLYIGYRVGGVPGMILALPIGIIVYTMYKEGVFDTTKKSFEILYAGVNHFRRITEKDMEVVEEYKKERDNEKF